MDNTKTIARLTDALRELPTDDIARVKLFLAEYLGNQAQPVPFGGRARDFARLEHWLAEPGEAPYALLAAPAGRGKSALLLRWCQQLLERSDVAVVYFPVSIRFRTNLAGVVFPALIALLARLHHETLPQDLQAHEEIWRGLFQEYLTRPLPDGRTLLLVLDGIDEAADWQAGPEFFPAEPPAHIRVILSARYLANDLDARAWLTRLGWTSPGLAKTFELYPLDRTGIASVLIQMGFPLDRLGTRVDILSELHRLSEGDPLLIRLYIDDLWRRGESATRLTPEDLQAIRPGLPGYFERWWNEQRTLWKDEAPERVQAIQTILNLLAGALGPLSREDILQLAPADAALKQEEITAHLEPLGRFVIGDGTHQGYVFSHPRLASYFLEERLSAAERQNVEERFLSWGRRTLNGLNAETLSPEDASPYIVQYYGAHLERAGADSSELFALVSDGWRRAWERLDRATAGFLGDSERAWRAAERVNLAALQAGQTLPALEQEVRSLLCRVSINSMTSNISPRLMLEAVKTGVWTPAQGLASLRLITEPLPRARELVGLAPAVQEPLRSDILQEALDTIATLKYERDRLDAFVELAHGFTPELLGQIIEIVHTVEDEADRAGVLAELAPALASSPTLLTQALEMALEIEEEEYLVLALEGLAPYLAAPQKQQVLEQTRQIEDERYRAQAFAALVSYLPVSLLSEILVESQAMRASISQIRLLAELVQALPQPARTEALQTALELSNELIDQEYRVELLLKLAPYLPGERLANVLTEIQELWDEGERARALCALLPVLPHDLLPAFLENVLALQHEEQRVLVLLKTLPRLPEELLTRVLDSVPAIWDEGLRVEVLATLAPFLPVELHPRLLELVDTTKDPGYRIWLLAELEQARVGSQHSTIITETFLAIEHTEERIQTLLAIVDRVSNAALDKVFALLEPEIFGFRMSLQSSERVADLFAKIAPRMPQNWYGKALEQVRMLATERAQAQVLIAMAPRIDVFLLSSALDMVRAISTREQRSQVLEALVAGLPQEHKGERVREMLQVLQLIKDTPERTTLFTTYLAPLHGSFPQARLRDVICAATTLRSETRAIQIYTPLLPLLSLEQLEMLLTSIRQQWSASEVAHTQAAMAAHLPEHLLPAFLKTVPTIKYEHMRATILTSLAEHATPSTMNSFLTQAQNIQDSNARFKLLSVLVARLPEENFSQFWVLLQRHPNSGQRAWLLHMLAAHVPQKYFAVFWAEFKKIEDLEWQMRALTALAAHTPENTYPQLWAAVQEHADKRWRARALTSLAPTIPTSFFPRFLQEVLATTNMPEPSSFRHEQEPPSALVVLAERVPEEFFLRFWKAASQLEDQELRFGTLLKLAERVPEQHFSAAWNSLSEIKEENTQREHLYEKLMRQMPEGMFEQAWQIIQQIEEPWRRNKWLLALAERVPERFIAPFWQAIGQMHDPRKQAAILAVLAPKLTPEQVSEGIELALRLAPPGVGVQALQHLLPRVSPRQNEELLERLLPAEWKEEQLPSIFTDLNRKYSWWKQLAVILMPLLPEERLQVFLPPLFQHMRGQLHTTQDSMATLKQLLTHVPFNALASILEIIWSIEMDAARWELLQELFTAPTFTVQSWGQVLATAREKTRTTGQARYLSEVLHTAPIDLQRTDPQALYQALNSLLHLYTQQPRRATLRDLGQLTTTLRALGDDEACLACACSILEIGLWWP